MNITHRLPRSFPAPWHALVTMSALLALAATTLTAQRFQYTYGGLDPDYEEGNALDACANGDFITAGTSTSLNAYPEIYIARTDGDGILLWDNVYSITGATYGVATDIEEYPNGDFVVVGNAGTSTNQYGFVMRIDAGGSVIWTSLILVPSVTTQARSVVISQSGHAIVAGSVFGATPGTSLGMLSRYDQNGAQLWIKTYDVAGNPDDHLYGVDEAYIPPPSARLVTNGGAAKAAATPPDIIAVGSSYNSADWDLWALRVNDTGGIVPFSFHGSALYGTSEDDFGTSITYLRYGSQPGDMAMTGRTYGRPSTPGQSEVIVLQLLPNPDDVFNPQAGTYFGDDQGEDEWGLCIHEIASHDNGHEGNLIVSGGAYNAGFGESDAFLQEFENASLVTIGPFVYYGEDGDEEGRAVTEVTGAAKTPGFVFVGPTASANILPPGNGKNLWLVKTDVTLNSNCNFNQKPMSEDQSPFPRIPITTTIAIPTPTPSPVFSVNTTSPSWLEAQICYSPTKTTLPRAAGNAITMEYGARPNPVHQGGQVSIGYRLATDGTATITVTDVLGRVIYQKTTGQAAGSITEIMSTEGWSTGMYMATVSAGGNSVTARIVVLDR